MEKVLLKSIMSFVEDLLQKWNDCDINSDKFVMLLEDYKTFLKQPLTLGMFVPCDLDGNVLEEIIRVGYAGSEEMLADFQEQKIKEYQEAKERVLFSGVEFVEAEHEGSYRILRICKSLSPINYPELWKCQTVESLVKYNLELTESAINQSGL